MGRACKVSHIAENGELGIRLGITYGLVVGSRRGNGALRAAIARVGGVDDGNLVDSGSGGLGIGRGEDRKEEGSDLGMHFGVLFSDSGSEPSGWWLMKCWEGMLVLICDDQQQEGLEISFILLRPRSLPNISAEFFIP